MILFPSRDAINDAGLIIRMSGLLGAAAALLMAVAFMIIAGADMFKAGVIGLVMAIALCGVGMFLNFHGRLFGMRYGASGHDDLQDVVPSMISQTFAGLIVLIAPIVAAIVVMH